MAKESIPTLLEASPACQCAPAAPTVLEDNVTTIEPGAPGPPLPPPPVVQAGPTQLAPAVGATFRGYRLDRPILAASAEADIWILCNLADGGPAILKLYRYGIRPKEQILAAVRRLNHSSVVRILDVGQVDQRHFEIQEFIRHGSLDALIGDDSTRQLSLEAILRELTEALADLHQAGIIHRDLKPSNILVRELEPLDLVLADFGISSLSDLSLHLSNANRTAAYAAPEAMTGVVARASDWWSIGVILLEILTGRHPFTGLDERAVNFALVSRGVPIPENLDPAWAPLIKGLLTRDHTRRWGLEQLTAWLAGQRDIPLYYTGETGSPTAAQKTGYTFCGREFHDLHHLALALVEHWDEAVKRLARGSLGEWVHDYIGDEDVASALHDIREDRRLDEDQKLSAALLAMDPRMPLVWKGEVVTPEWLAAQATVRHLPTLLLTVAPDTPEGRRYGDDDVELVRRSIELIRAEQHASPNLLQRRLGISADKAGLILDELATRNIVGPRTNVLAREVLISRDDSLSLSSTFLESSLPGWLERLRGEIWLLNLAGKHRAAWEFFREARLPMNRTEANQLILSPHTDAVWPLVEERRRRFARSTHETLNHFLATDQPLSWLEAIALATADPARFLTHDQALLESAFRWLDGLQIEYDRRRAERLILARDWRELEADLRRRRSEFVRAGSAELDRMLHAEQPEYLEAVAVICALSGCFQTAAEAWLQQARDWHDRLRSLRRSLRKEMPPRWSLSLNDRRGHFIRLREQIRTCDEEVNAFLRRAPKAPDPDSTGTTAVEAREVERLRVQLLQSLIDLRRECEHHGSIVRRRPWLLWMLITAALANLGAWLWILFPAR